MSTIPTMQSLALYARQRFGEDIYHFDASTPSSLDIVVIAYAEETNVATVVARAGLTLQQCLQSRGNPVTEADVDTFVREGITYLQAAYPNPEVLRQEEKRRFLSHLYWRNLVEAGHVSRATQPESRAGTVGKPEYGVETVMETVSYSRRGSDSYESYSPEGETRTIATRIAHREQLAGALNDALHTLARVLDWEGQGKHLDFVLQRSISHHADDTTLARILQDVKHEIAAVEEELLVRR